MDATPYAPYPVRLSPTTRAVKEAAALLGRPGVLPVMLTTFLLCALLTAVPLMLADCALTFFSMASLPSSALRALGLALNLLAYAAIALVILPVWLGRLRLGGALLSGEETPSRAVFYYMTSPRRWGRALAALAIFAALLAVPVGFSAGLFVLCNRLYHLVFLTRFLAPVAALFYGLTLMAAAALVLLLLFLSGVFLPFLAVAAGNDDLRLSAALAISLRAGARNLATCAAFLLKSFLRLLLGLLTVGVLQALWNTHLFILSYMRLSMALCPKGEPQ